MAKTSSIDRKDAKTKKAIVQDIIKGVPVRKIALQNNTDKDVIQRYKKKVQGYITRKANQEKEYVFNSFDEIINTAYKLIKRMDGLCDTFYAKVQEGDADADKFLKVFLEVANSLRPMLTDFAKITGNMKEDTIANNSPTLILAQIQQVIQQNTGGNNADIIQALDKLRQ